MGSLCGVHFNYMLNVCPLETNRYYFCVVVVCFSSSMISNGVFPCGPLQLYVRLGTQRYCLCVAVQYNKLQRASLTMWFRR